MTSRTSMGSSKLGDSWVINDLDGSKASLEQDAKPATPYRRSTKGHSSNMQPSRPQVNQPKTSRASSAMPEPELIMPSMYENKMVSPQREHQPRKWGAQSRSVHQTSGAGQPNTLRSTSRVAHKLTSEQGSWIWDVLVQTMGWFLEIAGGTLKALKKPITWVLVAYIIAGLLTLMQNLLTTTIRSALSPFCRIPGSSLLNLPICQSPVPEATNYSGAPVEFDKLMNIQFQFEDMLQDSSRGLPLPREMSRSEMVVRDLRQVVKYSKLRSKNELLLEFEGYIQTAMRATYDLQKFNSHVGRTVDMILVTARWTQRHLDDIAAKQSSRGAIASFMSDRLLAPFQPTNYTEDKILHQYITHIRRVSEEIQILLDEGQEVLLLLRNLEERIGVIHGIALEDNLKVQGSKDEVLSALWTALGGNRRKLEGYNEQLEQLKQVSEHRKEAFAHVMMAILKLQAMHAQVADLKEEMKTAEKLEDQSAIPLAVHMETLRLGVERLEKGRKANRETQDRHIRRVLDKAQEGERKFVLELGD